MMKPVSGLHSAAVNRALEPKNLHLQELGNEKRLAMNWTQRKGLKKNFSLHLKKMRSLLQLPFWKANLYFGFVLDFVSAYTLIRREGKAVIEKEERQVI